MANALRSTVLLGEATTGTRIAAQPASSQFETALFQAYERAYLKANPTLKPSLVLFHEVIASPQHRAFFKKSALPVTSHLLSVMLTLERTLVCTEQAPSALGALSNIVSEVVVDLDCFFIGQIELKASLHFKPLAKQASIKFADQNGKGFHTIDQFGSIALKSLPGDLDYIAPPALCDIARPKTGQTRLLSGAEVLNINTRINAANEEKAQSVKNKLRSSLPEPTALSIAAHQAPAFPALSGSSLPTAQTKPTIELENSSTNLFDEGYLITKHWR